MTTQSVYTPDVIGAGSRLMQLLKELTTRSLPPKGIATPMNTRKRKFDRENWEGPNGEVWSDLTIAEKMALDEDYEPPTGHPTDDPDFAGFAKDH